MRPRHRVSHKAFELIKRFEGYRRKAAQLPDGRWTIGYGHTLTAREGAEVSEDDAEALLIYDLIGVAHEINERVFTPLTQNQFDALCSFAFNLGLDRFRNSQVLKRLNEGQVIQAGCAMELWRKAEFAGERIVVDALVRRRAAEKLLFFTPPGDAWVPAPSAVLRPVVDADAARLVPADPPSEVVTLLDGERVLVSRDGEPAVALSGTGERTEVLRTAAETVAARLQSILPEPGDTPQELPFLDQPQAEVGLQAAAAAPGDAAAEQEAEADVAQPQLDFTVPAAPADEGRVRIDDGAAYDFIPPRVHPLPRPREPSLVLDILLGLLGLAFFSFGIVWGVTAKPNPSGAFVNPLVVGWLAGIAGAGFCAVAVFRLLQRLGRAAERG